MQNLLQPGCSSELEKDGGEDPGGVISFLDFFGQTRPVIHKIMSAIISPILCTYYMRNGSS